MNSEFELPFPQYRCPTCGKDLPLGEAHMVVSCASHTAREAVAFDVKRAEASDTADIETICDRAMGETLVDLFGRSFEVLDAVNFVARGEEGLLGVLSLFVHEGEATIVLLSVYPASQGTGVGSALLAAADRFAAERGLQFMRVAVTNDDIPQISFYQRHGFALYEAAIGESADRLGGAVPGFSGIPIRDELRLRRAVCHSG